MENQQVMYGLKPILDSSKPVDTPDCMYRLKSYHNDSQAGGDVDPAIVDLERRQENILQRLEQLKVEVDRLAKQKPATAAAAGGSRSGVWNITAPAYTETVAKDGSVLDLVISANPASPPYSLLVLQQMLSQQYKVLTSCFAHSSALSVGDKLRNIFPSNGITSNRNAYQLAFTLIWKDVCPSPTLTVSACHQTPVVGEGPIARYLARLLSPAYDSGDIVTATEIDNMVDAATSIVNGNNKEKAAALRNINSRLGRSQYLVRDSLTLADISVWAAIVRTGSDVSSSANVKRWFESCSANSAFAAVQQML